MNRRLSQARSRWLPVLVAAAVIVVMCVLQAVSVAFPGSLPSRLEWMTYDFRVRYAAAFQPAAASSLGAVFIDDESIDFFNKDEAFGYAWPWPRWLHGELVRKLHEAGAEAVGFDILFAERHRLDYRTAPPDPYYVGWPAPVWTQVRDLVGSREALESGTNRLLSSDGYFAVQLHNTSNVVLAVMGNEVEKGLETVVPDSLFATNALAVAHVMGMRDEDGVLRRARAFYEDSETGHRYWQLGLVLAARQLGLDLDRAVLRRGALEIPGRRGVGRTIPVDAQGRFYIDWGLDLNDPRLVQDSVLRVLTGEQGAKNSAWRGRLVVVGSIGKGNNVSDLGATPLRRDTFLVSKHWNVANSVLQNRFIRRSGYGTEAALIVLMGILSGVVTWRLRALRASLVILLILMVYAGLAFALYTVARYWLPLVMPLGGALLMTHTCLVTYRVVVEQRERTRVRSIFDKVVSPRVVNELLQSEQLGLEGMRRQVSVYFADIRGFTAMADEAHATAEAFIREHGLSGVEAEAYLEAQAREVLVTVNLYLGIVADTILRFNGTFDKYIGDCAMAFWGAPTPDERHAVHCVRAAIEAQQRIYALNAERAAENDRRQRDNEERAARNEPPLSMLKLLALGSGINTGIVTVGLMGSEKHTMNYTVFGREVNLASRLEGTSGRGRILISESTHRDLQRLDPRLADACMALAPVTVKGFREPVRVFEVQWRQLGDQPIGYDTAIVTGGGPTDFPGPPGGVEGAKGRA